MGLIGQHQRIGKGLSDESDVEGSAVVLIIVKSKQLQVHWWNNVLIEFFEAKQPERVKFLTSFRDARNCSNTFLKLVPELSGFILTGNLVAIKSPL